MNKSDKKKYCPKIPPPNPKLNPQQSPNNNQMNLLNLG